MGAPQRSIKDFFPSSSKTKPITIQNDGTQQASAATSSLPNPEATPAAVEKQPSLELGSQDVPFTSSLSSALSMPSSASAISHHVQSPLPSQASADSGASWTASSTGKQVVPNSDSDADSLPDLDWGEPRTAVKKVTPIEFPKHARAVEQDALRRPEKKGKNSKNSFNVLVQTAHQDMITEQEIIRYKTSLNKPQEAPARKIVAISEETLGQVMDADDEDPDKAHRLFLAMQRTNATQAQSAFRFFTDTSDSISVRPAFPIKCLPPHRWASNFADSVSRDQAFLTGFAYQVFRVQQLPEELACWMLDQICRNTNDVLNTKYVDVLELNHVHLRKLLSNQELDTMFKVMGAKLRNQKLESELCVSLRDIWDPTWKLPSPLKSVAQLLRRAAPWLHPEARAYSVYILCHVSLDDRVLLDADILDAVRDTIEVIITLSTDDAESTTKLDTVTEALVQQIKHPIFQKNLIYALPSRSSPAASFQRSLALRFLVQPTVVPKPLLHNQIIPLLHAHLHKSPDFQLKKGKDEDINYSHLAARVTLLDMAIGPGLVPVPEASVTNSAPFYANTSTTLLLNPKSPEAFAFNSQVDALTQQIKLLGNSIVEAEAAVDLTILDAKDCVERLCARLEHVVRIGGKRVRNMFDDDDESKQRKLGGFIFRKKGVRDHGEALQEELRREWDG